MAKKIIRRANLVNRNVETKIEKENIVENSNKEMKNTMEFLGNIVKLQKALDYQHINYEMKGGEFVIGEVVAFACDKGYEVCYNGEEEWGNTPLDVVRVVNRLCRSQQMAPVYKGKEITMDVRLKLLRERSMKLGLHTEIEPTDAELLLIEATPEEAEVDINDLIVPEKNREFEDDKLEEDEAFEALCFLMGPRNKVPQDMPRISIDPVEKKEVDTFIPMTSALAERMQRLGLDPDDACGDGNFALELIEEGEAEIKRKEKREQSFKEAYRDYVHAIFGVSAETASALGHENLKDEEMEALIQMSY